VKLIRINVFKFGVLKLEDIRFPITPWRLISPRACAASYASARLVMA